jgi:hypothetical protein
MKPIRRPILFLALALGLPWPGAAETEAPVPPVLLPPFLVEGERVGSMFGGTDWLYARDGEFEVLSACPQDETEQFIRNLRAQRSALRRFIPDELLRPSTLPTTLILVPKTQKNRIDEQMVKDVERIPKASKTGGSFLPMNDLRLSDPDSTFIFVILDDRQWGWDIRHGYPKGRESALFYTPQYLAYLLSAHTPALPDWYVRGVISLYESMAFNNSVSGALNSAWTAPLFSGGNPWDNVSFQRDTWLSDAAAAALRADPGSPRPLLSLRELLVPAPDPGKSAAYRQVWKAQSELFARWCYSGRITDGQARLQAFAMRASAEPVSDELFRSSFGLGISDARDALSDFLPEAVRKAQPFPFPPMPFDRRPVELRGASPSEIRRITGEWTRRACWVVRSNYPAALPLFLAKTRALLQGPVDRGATDPSLLASAALFRLDSGDLSGGRQLLEDNPSAVAARPLAALELAKLRLDAALKNPAGAGGALSYEQSEGVLQTLSLAFNQEPAVEAAYLLAERLTEHLGRDPTDAERGRLNEGARLFPREWQLVMKSVSWDLRAHDLDSAVKLTALGEYEAADAVSRARFGQLREMLRAAVGGN